MESNWKARLEWEQKMNAFGSLFADQIFAFKLFDYKETTKKEVEGKSPCNMKTNWKEILLEMESVTMQRNYLIL